MPAFSRSTGKAKDVSTLALSGLSNGALRKTGRWGAERGLKQVKRFASISSGLNSRAAFLKGGQIPISH